MQWSELYDGGHEPLENQIRAFVATPLWDELAQYVQQIYNGKPKLFYSCCSMDKGIWKGWNIKYRKSGKNLCTLYPRQGSFTAIVGRNLPIEVTDEKALQEVQKLIAMRM
jgi:AraC family transcriptional regulator